MKASSFSIKTASAAFLLFIVTLTISSTANGSETVKPEKITISGIQGIESALVSIAAHNGFFLEQNLTVVLKTTDLETNALSDTLEGKTNLALIGQSSIVKNSFDRNDFSILCTIHTSNNHYKILTNNASGIKSPKDLKAKRIGVTTWSGSHYFLSSYLVHHGMTLRNVRLKKHDPAKLISTLEAGDLDAIVLTASDAAKVSKGGRANTLSEPDIYISTLNFVAKNSYIKKNKDTIKRLVLALSKAENFLKNNKIDTIKLLSKVSDISKKDLEAILQSGRFKLSLDQSLLMIMEQEATWMKRNDLISSSQNPNYLHWTSSEILKETKPDAIGMIHV